MKRLLLGLVFTIIASNFLHAQERSGQTFMKKLEKVFSEIDTTYISPNRYNLTFMLEQSFWHERYRLRTKIDDGNQRIVLAPDPTPKIGAYFGWRWIFLGFSFSIPDMLKKNSVNKKKKEFVFNLYSSRIGLDLFYRQSGNNYKIASYSGFDLPDSYKGNTFEGFESKMVGMNTYWIFNNRRFSYPAAYSQSTNQRRSCGSFMAGFSYSHHDISSDYTQLPDEMEEQTRPSLRFNKLKYDDVNLSFGYGYNWVFAKNCLLNLTLMPALSYKRAKIDGENPSEENLVFFSWMKDINVDLITRAGIVWNNGKYYVGSSLVMNTYDYRKTNFSMTNTFGSLRIYAGFNFWKRKK